ncbi:DUF2690 domain-containing protein [Lentzea alba]|uniref:DUF2690 domain-containing protein n=1 Tax=Lentzea alba TaxID=2714351 RepID=UPI0039BF3F77
MKNKLLTSAAVTAGLTVAMLGGATASVSAAPTAAPVTAAVTCTGAGCDHKDPYDSGCGASRVEAGRKASSKGTFFLYYSTVCKTNWIEVPNYGGGTPSLELSVEDTGRGKIVRYDARPTPGRHYGNLIYSPGSTCAFGLADWDADSTWEVIVPSSGC